MQTQGRNSFSVLAYKYGYHANDRISNQKNLLFSGEYRSQSAQSSKFEIHHAFIFSMYF